MERILTVSFRYWVNSETIVLGLTDQFWYSCSQSLYGCMVAFPVSFIVGITSTVRAGYYSKSPAIIFRFLWHFWQRSRIIFIISKYILWRTEAESSLRFKSKLQCFSLKYNEKWFRYLELFFSLCTQKSSRPSIVIRHFF